MALRHIPGIPESGHELVCDRENGSNGKHHGKQVSLFLGRHRIDLLFDGFYVFFDTRKLHKTVRYFLRYEYITTFVHPQRMLRAPYRCSTFSVFIEIVENRDVAFLKIADLIAVIIEPIAFLMEDICRASIDD